MEAHASDEWPIGALSTGTAAPPQHKSVEERLEAAKLFKTSHHLHPEVALLVDPIDNVFNNTYQSWPTRAWIISSGKVVFKSMPGDGSGAAVNVKDLHSELKVLFSTDDNQ